MTNTTLKTKRRKTANRDRNETGIPGNDFPPYLGHGWNGWRDFSGARYICDSCGADLQSGCEHSGLRAFGDWKYFASQEEQTLADALESYTDPASPEYDPKFDQEIRKADPNWFGQAAGKDQQGQGKE